MGSGRLDHVVQGEKHRLLQGRRSMGPQRDILSVEVFDDPVSSRERKSVARSLEANEFWLVTSCLLK